MQFERCCSAYKGLRKVEQEVAEVEAVRYQNLHRDFAQRFRSAVSLKQRKLEHGYDLEIWAKTTPSRTSPVELML